MCNRNESKILAFQPSLYVAYAPYPGAALYFALGPQKVNRDLLKKVS